MILLENVSSRRPVVVLATQLPGPDRRRSPSLYNYSLIYRNPDSEALGCLLLWEVTGGRHAYQLALERDGLGDLRCHCTCADAIFRGGLDDHLCKHIQGFIEVARMLGEPLAHAEVRPRTGPFIRRAWQQTSLPN